MRRPWCHAAGKAKSEELKEARQNSVPKYRQQMTTDKDNASPGIKRWTLLQNMFHLVSSFGTSDMFLICSLPSCSSSTDCCPALV